MSYQVLARKYRPETFADLVGQEAMVRTLHEAGLSWQKSRTWCETGVAMRQRKHGVVRVSDPDAAVKRG